MWVPVAVRQPCELLYTCYFTYFVYCTRTDQATQNLQTYSDRIIRIWPPSTSSYRLQPIMVFQEWTLPLHACISSRHAKDSWLTDVANSNRSSIPAILGIRRESARSRRVSTGTWQRQHMRGPLYVASDYSSSSTGRLSLSGERSLVRCGTDVQWRSLGRERGDEVL